MGGASLDIFKSWRVLVFGAASWLLPFALAFAFFDSSGNLLVSQPLFKSSMVVAGGSIGVILLVLTMKNQRSALVPGLLLGLFWLAINLVLDVAFLLPMSGQSFAEYFSDTGLRYTLLPVMAAALGYMAKDGRARS
jgi:hypothetical protein